jgi:hypothetical protein
MVIKPPNAPAVPAHPSGRAIRKLRTASRRIETVSMQWDQYRAQAAVTFDPEIDVATNTVQYIAHVTAEPPFDEMEDEVRAVVADARSALDNLIHDLGVSHGVGSARLAKNAFPAVAADRASDWASRASKSLAGLPRDVVVRVRAIQPFSQASLPGLVHPATLLSQLSNDDKHKHGLHMALVPHITGTHHLASAQFTVPTELLGQLTRGVDPDQIMDFDPNAVVNGAAVVTLRFPPTVDLASLKLSPLDLPLSLALIRKGDDRRHPLLPSMRNALRWAREAARYVSGASDRVPEPHDRSLLAPPSPDITGA